MLNICIREELCLEGIHAVRQCGEFLKSGICVQGEIKLKSPRPLPLDIVVKYAVLSLLLGYRANALKWTKYLIFHTDPSKLSNAKLIYLLGGAAWKTKEYGMCGALYSRLICYWGGNLGVVKTVGKRGVHKGANKKNFLARLTKCAQVQHMPVHVAVFKKMQASHVRECAHVAELRKAEKARAKEARAINTQRHKDEKKVSKRQKMLKHMEGDLDDEEELFTHAPEVYQPERYLQEGQTLDDEAWHFEETNAEDLLKDHQEMMVEVDAFLELRVEESKKRNLVLQGANKVVWKPRDDKVDGAQDWFSIGFGGFGLDQDEREGLTWEEMGEEQRPPYYTFANIQYRRLDKMVCNEMTHLVMTNVLPLFLKEDDLMVHLQTFGKERMVELGDNLVRCLKRNVGDDSVVERVADVVATLRGTLLGAV